MKTIKAKSVSYGGTRSLNSIKYIVIHYTGNKKDTAENNAKYFATSNTRAAGAHIFIDQHGNVVLSIDYNRIAWSVGGSKYPDCDKTGGGKYYGKCTNTNSISIELCDIVDKQPSEAMVKAVKATIADIRKKCPNATKVINHFAVTGKQCPASMLKGLPWNNFLVRIGEKNKPKIANCPPALKKGSKGSQVELLQKDLNYIIGCGLTVDGNLGDVTVKALKEFQTKYKLSVDGAYNKTDKEKVVALLK